MYYCDIATAGIEVSSDIRSNISASLNFEISNQLLHLILSYFLLSYIIIFHINTTIYRKQLTNLCFQSKSVSYKNSLFKNWRISLIPVDFFLQIFPINIPIHENLIQVLTCMAKRNSFPGDSSFRSRSRVQGHRSPVIRLTLNWVCATQTSES